MPPAALRVLVMMAFDSRSTPEPRVLSDETRRQLRAAVLELWARSAAGDDALAAALDRMIHEARERALRAEELIVAFKALLADLPELDAGDRRLEAAHFRERLITLSIKAYYGR